jgi:hypothetical protein
MAGTNAIAIKTALVNLLTPALAPTVVHGSYNGHLVELEYVYIGKILGPQQPMTFRSAARLPREETLIVDLHLEVAKKTATTTETDARFAAIGQLIEEALANDPLLAGAVPGLMAAWMSHVQVTSFFLQDGMAATEGIYQITVQSRLG